MLQHEKFLTELVNSQCTRFVDDQLIRVWLQYKKKHDWIRYDPTRVPDNVQNLFTNTSVATDAFATSDSTSNSEDTDYFSALTIMKNEKF